VLNHSWQQALLSKKELRERERERERERGKETKTFQKLNVLRDDKNDRSYKRMVD
jgi:hypothetical protein